MISPMSIFNAPGIFIARASGRIIIPLTLANAGKYPTTIDVKRSIAMTPKRQCITMDNINPHLKRVKYLVRGPITMRADAIEKELSEGQPKPFKEVIRAHFGDSHALGQVPITFVRQVLALVTYPELLLVKGDHFPEDVKQKARNILNNCKGGSVGSYTEIPGIESIRRHVATFIQERDGFPSHWSDVILTSGASIAIKSVLKLFICDIEGKRPGCMVPIPQYPLYSATLAEFNIAQVEYYLDESKNWGLTLSELERSLTEARKTCNPRVLTIINPGNPTGQVLTKENIQEIIKFAYKENLFILADEVYQHNVFAEGSEFHSFKKVMMELGAPFNTMELASFMSCSKGYMGECGIRGGYVELINLCPEVKAVFMKAISASLCPNVLGQAVMDCVTAPPKKGDLSYELYAKERDSVLEPLREKARIISETYNSIPGISCNPVQGAMYAFPQLILPPKAVSAAEKKGVHPDSFYATGLLEKTGMCVVPGSGFGQKPGTYHFRTNILMKKETITDMFQKFSKYHTEFLEEYK